ncbi:carbohydrate ABC transporter permease [Isoptericola halotolerans]|uniref:Multiple sugar transport system permease protein n=1 Tax=Isoptericola halotolerans TaxID=300560 RepID=A0ABX2A748_9MICO|nr:carbohydrate ABC transporter permease [Isoptericola halotolerans]NOV98648.1 multiple sugar transport system permease protein [Isoptericola halotolerans]
MRSDVSPAPVAGPATDDPPALAGPPPAVGDVPVARRRRRPRAVRGLLVALLVVLSVPFVFPTWWMATSSLKPMSEILRVPPTLWPQDVSWGAYADVFALQPFAQQYWNSLYIAVLVTAGTILVASLAGYAFARISFPGANVLFVLVLAGMLVPAEVTIVPLFRLVNTLGLIDTHWPLIVVPIFGAPSVLATFIMRQFFLGLPRELEEAGRMDGLSRWGIFWRIAFPLARPAVAAVAIFTFLKSWNLYLEPIVYLSSRENFTLPQALTQYVDAYGGPMWNVQLAATTLTVIPVLAVFLVAQRQFVQGLAHTGLKG